MVHIRVEGVENVKNVDPSGIDVIVPKVYRVVDEVFRVIVVDC